MLKIGRNDPCFCGSGKKYKQCHGRPATVPVVQPDGFHGAAERALEWLMTRHRKGCSGAVQGMLFDGLSEQARGIMGSLGEATWTGIHENTSEWLLAEGEIPGIHCYVLDVRLPGKSGIELTRELSAAGSKVPVIFITAHDEPSVREAVERCGAAALLIKPFAGRKLLDTLETTFNPIDALKERT